MLEFLSQSLIVDSSDGINNTQQWIASEILISDISGGIANPPNDGAVYGRGFDRWSL